MLLLEKLDYYELEGVIAHELSHIKNYDIRLSCVVSVMVGFIVMLSDIFTRVLFWGGTRDNDDDSRGNIGFNRYRRAIYEGVVISNLSAYTVRGLTKGEAADF